MATTYAARHAHGQAPTDTLLARTFTDRERAERQAAAWCAGGPVDAGTWVTAYVDGEAVGWRHFFGGQPSIIAGAYL
jgi:hypothetical protein